MNEHESEKIEGALIELGYKQSDDVNALDIIVFNTCCIRESAEKKIAGHIGALKNLKADKPDLTVAVMGCMTQQQGYAENLKKKFPFIDIILGTFNIKNFKEILKEYLDNKKKIIEITDDDFKIDENFSANRESNINAKVNIMYGCDNFCTYCIVPYVRGRERSRKVEDILNEVNCLLDKGYKEIMLLGQNVNSYKDKDVDFAGLITKISNIDRKFRLRFMTSHPKDLSEKIVLAIKDNINICKAIHLPVQSGSDKILKLMNRKYSKNEYLYKIKLLRKHIPDIEISTDIIAGFPGETEEDFLDTYNLMEQIKFSHAYTFIYSKRRGTKASLMDNQIEAEVKKARIQKIINLQKEISLNNNKNCVGKTYEVLAEKISNYGLNILMGKTNFDKQVFFKGSFEDIGKFVNIKINRVTPTALFGIIDNA